MRKNFIQMGLGFVAGVALSSAVWADTPATYDQVMKEALQKARTLQYSAAVLGYEQAIGLATNAAQKTAALIGKGHNLVSAEQMREGRTVLEEILKSEELKPDDRASILESIGHSYLMEHDYGLAISTYKQMTKVQGANPAMEARGWAHIGQSEYAAGNFDTARQSYEEAVKIPNVALVHLQAAWPGIGDCFMAEGKYAEARKAYERILAVPNVDDFLKLKAAIGIGNSCYDAADYPGAAQAYLGVVKIGKQTLRIVERLDTIFRKQLAKADALLGSCKYAEARMEYEKVLTMAQVEEHHKASAELGMGDALAGEMKYVEARAEYEKTLGMKGAYWPDRGRARLGIAKCYEAEGNVAEARKAYEKLPGMKNVSGKDVAVAQDKIKTMKP